MNIKKMFAGATTAVMALTVLTGCGGNAGSAGSSNVARVNLGSEPAEMNSFLTTDAVAGDVLRHSVEGLTTLDANDKAVAGVAKEWSYDEATSTWTFKLRDNSKWHQNGETVTANDFAFAWHQLFDTRNGGQYASTWAPLIDGAQELMAVTAYKKDADGKPTTETVGTEEEIAAAKENVGFKAVDDYTFTVKTTANYPFFLELMAFYSFAPINETLYNEMGGLDSYGKDADKIATNGAFKITEWNHETNIKFEKYEDYWNKDQVKLSGIEMQMIKDSGTALNAFENNEIDMVGLTGEQAKQIKADNKYEVHSFSDGANAYFEFNTSVPGLNNAKVRKALTMAIDRQQYIDTVLLNSSVAGEAFTPNSVLQGTFTEKVGQVFEPVTDDYASIKAMLEEGLKEEGINPEDFTLTLLGDSGDSPQKSYAFFQEQWRTHLGIDVQIDQQEFQTRIERMNSGDFDIVFALWGPDYNDPMTYLDIWVTDGGNNHTGWSNAEYDELVNAARYEGDTEKRDEMLIQLEGILAEEMPVGIVYYRVRDYVVKDGLKNVIRTSASNIDCRYAYFE